LYKQPGYRATQVLLMEVNWKENLRLPRSRSLSWVREAERSG